MTGSRAALIVGVAAISALVVGFFWLNDDKAPDFPAIPKPVDPPQEAEEPAGSRHFKGRSAVRPAPEPTQTATAAPESAPSPAAPTRAVRPRQPHDELLEATRAEPDNPTRWVDFAKAADRADRHDLALAGLKRALRVGGDFEGRAAVERVVLDHEEAVRLGRAPTVPMSVLDDKKDGDPDYRRRGP